MQPTDDTALLRRYAENNSDEAFAALVTRHINLVYSVALRQVGNPHAAEEIAQAVFIILAKKAAQLRHDKALSSWLFQTTRLTANNFIRSESRRHRREEEAFMQSVLDEAGTEIWPKIAPLLDGAVAGLREKDRQAIVLRFYEGRNLREVGQALDASEDAAEKRVNRALEKLQKFFAKRGVASTTAAIAETISAHSVQIAPLALAKTVTAGSLAGAAGSGSVGLASLTIKMMLMKKTTTVALAVIAIAALVTVPVTLTIIKHTQANAPVSVKSLREGLVLDMPFEHDETYGKVTDRSGRGNHGRVSGAQWTADGKNGGGYVFAADGDEIVFSNNASLNPEQLTLAAWIKTSTGDHYWRRIFDKSYGQGFALSVAGDDQGKKWYGQMSMEIGPGAHCAMTTKRVNDGQWHHVAMTFDGAEELIYVDGQPQGKFHWSQPGRVGATDFNLVIGCNRSNLAKSEDDLGVSFRGMIGQPMMWSRALSTNEISFLYNSQNGSASAVASN